METSITNCLDSTRDLRLELIATAKDQTNELPCIIRAGNELVASLTNSASVSETDRMQESADRFRETIDHILEVSYAVLESL